MSAAKKDSSEFPFSEFPDPDHSKRTTEMLSEQLSVYVQKYNDASELNKDLRLKIQKFDSYFDQVIFQNPHHRYMIYTSIVSSVQDRLYYTKAVVEKNSALIRSRCFHCLTHPFEFSHAPIFPFPPIYNNKPITALDIVEQHDYYVKLLRMYSEQARIHDNLHNKMDLDQRKCKNCGHPFLFHRTLYEKVTVPFLTAAEVEIMKKLNIKMTLTSSWPGKNSQSEIQTTTPTSHNTSTTDMDIMTANFKKMDITTANSSTANFKKSNPY